jgi:hypothetical protein
MKLQIPAESWLCLFWRKKKETGIKVGSRILLNMGQATS